MPELSRRTLLMATTTLLTIPGGRAAASAAVGSRAPGAAGPPHQASSGQLGNLTVSIIEGVGLDALGIRIVVVNSGAITESVLVSAFDMEKGKRSHPRTFQVEAGKTLVRELFGHLNHDFMVQFCRMGGTCVQLGPIGRRGGNPQPTVGPRGINTSPVVPRQQPKPSRTG